MDWTVVTTRMPKELHLALKEISHQRRVSVNQLLLDQLHSLALQEGQPVCPYCEAGDRNCSGHGVCHCGCGMKTDAEKFIGNHHSRRVPLGKDCSISGGGTFA